MQIKITPYQEIVDMWIKEENKTPVCNTAIDQVARYMAKIALYKMGDDGNKK